LHIFKYDTCTERTNTTKWWGYLQTQMLKGPDHPKLLEIKILVGLMYNTQ